MQCFDRYQNWISILREIKALLIAFHYAVSVRILRAARLVTRRPVLERYLHPSCIRLFSPSFEFLPAPLPTLFSPLLILPHLIVLIKYATVLIFALRTEYFLFCLRSFPYFPPAYCSRHVCFCPWLSRELTCVPYRELRNVYTLGPYYDTINEWLTVWRVWRGHAHWP